jgi:hypothetical protein
MCFIQLKFYCLSMVNSYRDGYTVLASSRLLAILDPARFGARPCADFFIFMHFYVFSKKYALSQILQTIPLSSRGTAFGPKRRVV